MLKSLKYFVKRKLLQLQGIPWNQLAVQRCLVERLSDCGKLTLIDIGAASGQFADFTDSLFGVKKALLVEPQPKKLQELRQRYNDGRFVVAGAALTDREGTLDMEILEWDQSSSILPVKRDIPDVNAVVDLKAREVIKCRATTLDQLCLESKFDDPIDLIKIDVQGAEHLVLAGATQTLKRTKVIWTEVSFQPLYEGSPTITQIISQCKEQGFILLSLVEGFRGASGELLQADAVFVRS